MDDLYYQLFTKEKGEEKIRKVKVGRKTIENILNAYKNCPSQEINMNFGCTPKGIYDFSKMAKVVFKKNDYNSLKMILNDERIGMINDEKDTLWLANRCAKIWKLPLPFPKYTECLVTLTGGDDKDNKGNSYFVEVSRKKVKKIFNSLIFQTEKNLLFMGHVTKGEDKKATMEFQKGKVNSLEIKAKKKKAANLCAKYWKIKEPFDVF